MCDLIAVDDNGNPFPLDWLAPVLGLSWKTGWRNGSPGGFQQVSWKMDLDPNSTPPLLRAGRVVELYDGLTCVGVALLSEPKRGRPWEFVARGLSEVARDYVALDSSAGPTSVLDTALDAAIVRGAPWTRPASIKATAYSANATTRDLNYISDLADAVCEDLAKTWAVWGDRAFVAAADPTTPDWYYYPLDGLMGEADTQFQTHLYGRYVTTLSGTPPVPSAWDTATAANDDGAARWTRREAIVDLTALGAITGGRAAELVADKLARVGPRLGFTEGFTGTSDNLFTPGGVPARLQQVRAGQMVRVCGVLDTLGNLIPGLTTDVVLGETFYEDGASVVGLAPVGLVERDFGGILAAELAEDAGFSEAS